MEELFGQREILASDAVKLVASHGVLLKLRCGGARLRSNRRAARQKQRKQRNAREVFCLCEIPFNTALA